MQIANSSEQRDAIRNDARHDGTDITDDGPSMRVQGQEPHLCGKVPRDGGDQPRHWGWGPVVAREEEDESVESAHEEKGQCSARKIPETDRAAASDPVPQSRRYDEVIAAV